MKVVYVTFCNSAKVTNPPDRTGRKRRADDKKLKNQLIDIFNAFSQRRINSGQGRYNFDKN